jgi:chorismate dehydratase
MALRVAQVPYLHYEPFYFDMERRGIELVELVPSAIAAAAEHGDIDAAPFPLADSFRLANRFEPLAGFGVACLRTSGSLFLFASAPMEELDGARIAITDEAATAEKLLRILLQLKCQVQPAAYVTLQEPHDAFLLIGNKALRQRGGSRDFAHRYDLGAVWHAWTGLPCVLSRWMVRREVPPQDKALVEDTLYVGLEDGVNVLYQVAEPRDYILMRPRDIARYIQGFRYYFGLSEQQAIERFRHDLKQVDPHFRTLPSG